MFDSKKFVFRRLLHSYPLRPNFSGPHMFVYSFCKSTWFSSLLHFSSLCRLSLFSQALLQKLLIFLAFLSMTAPALFVILLRPSGATVAMATDDMCLPLYGVLIYIWRIIVSHEAQGRIRMSCNEMPAQATFVFVTARC